MMLRPILLSVLPIVMLAGCKGETPTEKPTVTDAFISANPVEGRPSAAYFTVHGGKEAAQLTGVSVGGAQKAEMHRTMNHKGLMSMEPMAAVSVPAGGTVEFKQGGNHVMVFGLSQATIEGGKAPISFTFANGETVAAEAKIQKTGQDGAGHGAAH